VTLRKFELSDVDAMMAWASDPQVAAPCRWDAYESTEPLLALTSSWVLGVAVASIAELFSWGL
jgi:hypothetical protein